MFFFDPPLFAWLNANPQTAAWSIDMARLFSAWLPQLAAGAVGLGLVFGSPAVRRSLLSVLAAMALAWCVARLIRWGFPMPRPYQLEVGMRWVEHGGRASFPSMHACGAFALAQALTLAYTRRFRWLIALAWASAVAVAWSRAHLGVHFPSDLIAGAVVGCASAYTVHVLCKAWGRYRSAARPSALAPATPAATPGAAPLAAQTTPHTPAAAAAPAKVD